jgi:hypothetical protein
MSSTVTATWLYPSPRSYGSSRPTFDRQLEAVVIVREAQIHVVGGGEVQAPALLEAERTVEAQRGVDIADSDAG